MEHPSADAGKLLPGSLLKEVLMNHEEQELEKLNNTVKVSRASAAKFRTDRKAWVEKLVPLPVAKAKAKPKAGTWRVPKWVASPVEGVDEANAYIHKHLPPFTTCRIAKSDGRWYISYARLRRRSVSWTQRGLEAAVDLVLAIAWGFHEETTELQPKWCLSSLHKRVLSQNSGGGGVASSSAGPS